MADMWIGGRRTRVPVFSRDDLSPGQRVAGPAIVEEAATLTVLHPGQTLRVDPYGMLIVSV